MDSSARLWLWGSVAIVALAMSCASGANAANAAPATSTAALSADAKLALAQVLKSQDNADAPFIVIDKRRARLWLFDRRGQAVGSTPVLLGYARGDETVPGIADKPLAQVTPGERTTPAGRFVAEPGVNTRGEDIIWVDYEAAVSMHRVRATNPAERRLQRLASPSAADNRISYGCINVPTAFYDSSLRPLLAGPRLVVYLLPETRPTRTLFSKTSKH